MVELITTPEERSSPSYLDWSDEAIGKAVRGMALVLGEGKGTESMMATAASCLLIKQILNVGSDQIKITLSGVTIPEHVGDWVVTAEKAGFRSLDSEYTDTALCPVCEKETLQLFRDSGHERDSSQDFRECSECGSSQYGHGEWTPPEGSK